LTTKARKLCARNQYLTGEDALRVMASRMERYDMTHKFDYELAKIEAEEWRRNRDDLALLLKAGGDANARYQFEKILITFQTSHLCYFKFSILLD
jgi:hypothetical protein